MNTRTEREHSETKSIKLPIEDEKPEPLPRRWWVFISAFFFLGFVLWIIKPPSMPFLGRISGRIPPDGWTKLISIFLWTMAANNLLLTSANYFLIGWLDIEGPRYKADFYGPAVLGMVESILYPGSFLINRPEFIGVWFVLKVAGQWNQWAITNGRRVYNKFLILSSASLMLGLFSYMMMKAFVMN